MRAQATDNLKSVNWTAPLVDKAIQSVVRRIMTKDVIFPVTSIAVNALH